MFNGNHGRQFYQGFNTVLEQLPMHVVELTNEKFEGSSLRFSNSCARDVTAAIVLQDGHWYGLTRRTRRQQLIQYLQDYPDASVEQMFHYMIVHSSRLIKQEYQDGWFDDHCIFCNEPEDDDFDSNFQESDMEDEQPKEKEPIPTKLNLNAPKYIRKADRELVVENQNTSPETTKTNNACNEPAKQSEAPAQTNEQQQQTNAPQPENPSQDDKPKQNNQPPSQPKNNKAHSENNRLRDTITINSYKTFRPFKATRQLEVTSRDFIILPQPSMKEKELEEKAKSFAMRKAKTVVMAAMMDNKTKAATKLDEENILNSIELVPQIATQQPETIGIRRNVYGPVTNLKLFDEKAITIHVNNLAWFNTQFPVKPFKIEQNALSANRHQDLAALRQLFERLNVMEAYDITNEKEPQARVHWVDVGSCSRMIGYRLPGVYLTPQLSECDIARAAKLNKIIMAPNQHRIINTLEHYLEYDERANCYDSVYNFTDSIYYIPDETLLIMADTLPLGLIATGTMHIFKNPGAISIGDKEVGTVEAHGDTYYMHVNGNPVPYSHTNRFPDLIANDHAYINTNTDILLAIRVENRVDCGATDYIRFKILKITKKYKHTTYKRVPTTCDLCGIMDGTRKVRTINHEHEYHLCQECFSQTIKNYQLEKIEFNKARTKPNKDGTVNIPKPSLTCNHCESKIAYDVTTMSKVNARMYTSDPSLKSDYLKACARVNRTTPEECCQVDTQPVETEIVTTEEGNSYLFDGSSNSVLDIKMNPTMPFGNTIVHKDESGKGVCLVPMRRDGYAMVFRDTNIKLTDTSTWHSVQHLVKLEYFTVDMNTLNKAFRTSLSADLAQPETLIEMAKVVATTNRTLPTEYISTVIRYALIKQLEFYLDLTLLRDSMLVSELDKLKKGQKTATKRSLLESAVTEWDNSLFKNKMVSKQMHSATMHKDTLTLNARIFQGSNPNNIVPIINVEHLKKQMDAIKEMEDEEDKEIQHNINEAFKTANRISNKAYNCLKAAFIKKGSHSNNHKDLLKTTTKLLDIQSEISDIPKPKVRTNFLMDRKSEKEYMVDGTVLEKIIPDAISVKKVKQVRDDILNKTNKAKTVLAADIEMKTINQPKAMSENANRLLFGTLDSGVPKSN